MKTKSFILIALILPLALRAQAEPAGTPKQLAERYAKALLAGDTNLAASCLLPLPAYAKAAGINPEKISEADLAAHHTKYLKKRLKDVKGFPAEAPQLGLQPDAVSKVSVVVNPPKENHVDPQVLFWFEVGADRWKCEIQGCFQHDGGWYLYDIHWLGKEERPQNKEPEATR